MIELVVIGILILIIGFLVYVMMAHKIVKIDGEVVISEKDGGGTVYSLELNTDLDKLENKSILTFQVRR